MTKDINTGNFIIPVQTYSDPIDSPKVPVETDDVRPFSAGLKKAKVVFRGLILLLFLALLIWIPIYTSINYIEIKLFGSFSIATGTVPMFLLYLLVVFLALFVIEAVIWSLTAPFQRGPAVRIDANGIYNKTGATAPGLITWDNIAFIYFVEQARQPMVRMDVLDASKMKAALKWHQRLLAAGSDTVSIVVKNVDCKPEELIDSIVGWAIQWNYANHPELLEEDGPEGL